MRPLKLRDRAGLLHQQHLPGTFDGSVELALVMRREAGVLARKNAASVGDELTEQSGVLEIKSIHGEIDFRLRTWSADFHCPAALAIVFIRMSFTRHKLLDFAVQSVFPHVAVVLHQFHLFGF